MSQLLQTEIVIEAGSEDVWAILANFGAYTEWNPFMPRISGTLEVGARLLVELAPPGGRPMTIRPTLREVQHGRGLRWLGHLGLPGLFDGEHRFQIEPAGERQMRFLHSERFSGLLVPLVLPLIGTSTRQGFEAMNRALKERAEAAVKNSVEQAA